MKIWEKAAAGNAGGLFPDPSGFFRNTLASDGPSYEGFFIADGTVAHKGCHYNREIQLGKGFFLIYTQSPFSEKGRRSSMTTNIFRSVRRNGTGLEKKIEFEYYAPLAKTVELAGTFNDWDPTQVSLKKDRSGKWKAALPLTPGRYEYRYLVDGVWQNDQRPMECVPNAFGTWNCVLEVQ